MDAFQFQRRTTVFHGSRNTEAIACPTVGARRIQPHHRQQLLQLDSLEVNLLLRIKKARPRVGRAELVREVAALD
jgi:hypothetical protein